MEYDVKYKLCSVERVKEEAVKLGEKILFVNCWVDSKGFYVKKGFIEVGLPYLSGDKQILCQRMQLQL